MSHSAGPQGTICVLGSRYSKEVRELLGKSRLATQKQSWDMGDLKGPRPLGDKPQSFMFGTAAISGIYSSGSLGLPCVSLG